MPRRIDGIVCAKTISGGGVDENADNNGEDCPHYVSLVGEQISLFHLFVECWQFWVDFWVQVVVDVLFEYCVVDHQCQSNYDIVDGYKWL